MGKDINSSKKRVYTHTHTQNTKKHMKMFNLTMKGEKLQQKQNTHAS